MESVCLSWLSVSALTEKMDANVKKAREFVTRLHALNGNAAHAEAAPPLRFAATAPDQCVKDGDVLQRASIAFQFTVLTPQEVRCWLRPFFFCARMQHSPCMAQWSRPARCNTLARLHLVLL
jgi:hypothetical protein